MKTLYKTLLLLIINYQLSTINCFSQQAPGIEWQNTIGGTTLDFAYSVYQTSDGGYIIGGTTNSDSSGDKIENSLGGYDYWVLKLDAAGNIQWQNTIGGSKNDHLYTVEQTTDGGYIIGGETNSGISGDKTEDSIGGYDYWILKLDTSGNIEWQNTIGGSKDDHLFCIRQTSDGGYIISGDSQSPVSGDKTQNNWDPALLCHDFWIVKTDSLGTVMWDKTIGGAIQEGFGDVYETDDGGYVLAGLSHSNISGDKTENSWGIMDYWILKLNAAGNIQWQNTIGGTMQDLFHSLTKTDDGGYLIGGWSDSYLSGNKTENSNGGHDYWIVKVDSTGAIQWQNTIGGSDTDALFCVKSIPDGFILCGASSSGISGDKTENPVGGSGFDYWILKTDLLGNILWQSTIGGNNEDVPHDVIQTSDNGYIIVGESESNISGDKNENCLGQTDFWIIKLSPETITSVSDLQVPSASGGLQIFPNPSSGIFQITFPDQKTNWTLEVLNTLGQKVFLRKESFGQSKLQTSNSKAQTNLDLSFLPKGIYILKVYDGVSAFNNKIIID